MLFSFSMNMYTNQNNLSSSSKYVGISQSLNLEVLKLYVVFASQ